MTKYYLRIICDSCMQTAAQDIVQFLHATPQIADLHLEPLAPYWKNPGQGELSCSFTATLPLAEIQAFFADHWEGDVADTSWSHIHIPHAVFLWLSA